MPSPSPVRQLLGPVLVTLLVAAVLTVAAPAGASGDRVLVFGGDLGAQRNLLEQRLTELGHTVTNSTALPADLSGYDSIWHVGLVHAHSSSQQAALAGYVSGGGGLYLSGEWDCCSSVPRLALQNLVRTLTGDDELAVGGAPTLNGAFSFNTAAVAGLGSHPNTLGSWAASSVGTLGGVGGPNVLATHSTGPVVGAAWTAGDLVAGSGRVVLLMDTNWLDNPTRADPAVIENIQTFLAGSDEPAENTAPSVEILAPSSGEVVEVGHMVSVVADVVDPDPGDSQHCDVSWGDGTFAAVDAVDGACTATRTYDTAGSYQLTVVATDEAGDSGSDTVEVVVVDTAVTITGGGSLEGRAAPFNVSVRYRPGGSVPEGQIRMRTPAGDVRAESLSWVLAASDGSHAMLAGTASVDDGPPRPFRLLIVPGQRGSASLALTWTDDEGPGATVGPLGVQGGSIQLRR